MPSGSKSDRLEGVHLPAEVVIANGDTPTVSVVLNAYNHADYVDEAIDSVLNQSLQDFELLVIDNGSTDATREVLESYADSLPVRLMLHDENRPVTVRLNEGVAAARGEFVSFLYSDDMYVTTKLERQVEEFRRHGSDVGVVYSPAAGINEVTQQRWKYPGLEASGWIFRDLMLRTHRASPIDMVSPMTRRACLLEHPFNEQLFMECEGIFLKLAMTYKFAYLDEPQAVLRDHLRNSGKAIRRNTETLRQVLNDLRRQPFATDQHRALIDRYEGRALRTHAWASARLANDQRWSRACLREALRASPRQAFHPKTPLTLALSLLPDRVRRPINRAGHVLRRAPGNAIYLEDYEGITADR